MVPCHWASSRPCSKGRIPGPPLGAGTCLHIIEQCTQTMSSTRNTKQQRGTCSTNACRGATYRAGPRAGRCRGSRRRCTGTCPAGWNRTRQNAHIVSAADRCENALALAPSALSAQQTMCNQQPSSSEDGVPRTGPGEFAFLGIGALVGAVVVLDERAPDCELACTRRTPHHHHILLCTRVK